MTARIGRLSASVGYRHPVTVRKASLVAGWMRRVWPLGHQTAAQYAAVEWTRAKVAVPSQSQQAASKSATRDINFLRSNSVSAVRACPVQLLGGMWVRRKGWGFVFVVDFQLVLLPCCLGGRLPTLLLWYWALTSRSGDIHLRMPCLCFSTPSTICHSPSACMIARWLAYAFFLETVFGKLQV